MPHSSCGKRLGWERPLQPSRSAAATQEPVRAATDIGMAHSFLSTMSEVIRKKCMTFTTMGHMARHPLHGLRPGQPFRDAIGAPQKLSAPWTLTCTANNTEASQCDSANAQPC